MSVELLIFAVLMLAAWGVVALLIWRGPVNQERPEIAHFGEVVEYHPGDTDLPDIAGREPLWAEIEDIFATFDQLVEIHKLKRDLEDQLWQREREALLAGPIEPFVPKVRHFGPLEGREMEYCHGAGQLVVHRKTCPRAPHEERRRYIWAFDQAQLGEWTDAEPGDWRHCRVCKPGAAPPEGFVEDQPRVPASVSEDADRTQHSPERAGHPGDPAPSGDEGEGRTAEEAADEVRVAAS